MNLKERCAEIVNEMDDIEARLLYKGRLLSAGYIDKKTTAAQIRSWSAELRQAIREEQTISPPESTVSL